MDTRREPELGQPRDDKQGAYPQYEREKPPNYVAWAIAVAAGVVVAYIAIRQYEIHQATELLKQIGKSGEQQMRALNNQTQAQLQRIREQQQAQIIIDRERRVGDPIGSKLSRQCEEWTKTTATMKSIFAEQEKNRFCRQLETYVNYGTHPRP